MNKKFIKIGVILLLLAVGYLVVAHYYIYHTIGKAHLPATDNRHMYIFNESLRDDRGIVYAALGDSLTSGVGTERYEESYPYLVAQKIAGVEEKVTHLNFSYPGARTDDLIQDLLAKAITEKPTVVTLLIGTNDAHGNVSQAEFARNYKYIVDELKSKTQAKIYLITIPYIGADDLLVPPYRKYFDTRVTDFNKVIESLADGYRINIIDLASETAMETPQAKYYATDLFHPSSKSYGAWAKYIYEHLNK